MIITGHTEVSARDTNRYAWAELRRFHNTRHVQEIHSKLNNVPAKFEKFIKKQAQQIRYCLIQAREYSQAAEAVSLATKPLLLYYSCMSLALAEVLLKQDGRSSLDMARVEHNHHGLILKINERAVNQSIDFTSAARAMLAAPMMRNNGRRSGTFELWHRTARTLPSIGAHTYNHAQFNQTVHHGTVLIPEDEPFDPIQQTGISLLDALRCVPGMGSVLHSYGVAGSFVRGRVSLERNVVGQDGHLEIVIHPTDSDIYNNFIERFRFREPLVDGFELDEFGGGAIVRLKGDQRYYATCDLPSSININRAELLFWKDQANLNEFGYIYIALYILGNFARYYPDLWMRCVEDSHPIATVCERFLELCETKMALATLSEMTRSYHILSE